MDADMVDLRESRLSTSEGHRLFAFGTLLDPAVQRHLFGTIVPTREASLTGHGLVDVVITDAAVIAASGLSVHRGLTRQIGQSVPGGVLHLTDAQLAQADEYEVSAYARRRVLLGDGTLAWAFVDADSLTAAERIGVVGDSIAYGRCDPTGGWAARLAHTHIGRDEENHRLFNLAIPGATLHGLGDHVLDELRVRRADTVLVAAGINDLAGVDQAPASPQMLLENLHDLCQHLETLGMRPLIIGPTWVDTDAAREHMGLDIDADTVGRYRDDLLHWASSTHRDVIDVWDVLHDRPGLLTDGVHPDPAGHEALWNAIRPTPATV